MRGGFLTASLFPAVSVYHRRLSRLLDLRTTAGHTHAPRHGLDREVVIDRHPKLEDVALVVSSEQIRPTPMEGSRAPVATAR